MSIFATAAIVAGGAALGSAALGAFASSKASKAQSQSADKATDLSREQYEQTREDQRPFMEGGYKANNRMLELLGIGGDTSAAGYGSANKPFSYSDMTADPGYSFRLSEGLKAMDQTAAARGGLMSGSALKAGQRYGQEMGSQEYQNAFNRYQINRGNVLGPLQGMLGIGQSATNQVGQYGSNYAANAGSTIMSGGNARASGYMGPANAISGGVGQYVNQMNNQALMERFFGGGSATGNPGNYGFTGASTLGGIDPNSVGPSW